MHAFKADKSPGKSQRKCLRRLVGCASSRLVCFGFGLRVPHLLPKPRPLSYKTIPTNHKSTLWDSIISRPPSCFCRSRSRLKHLEAPFIWTLVLVGLLCFSLRVSSGDDQALQVILTQLATAPAAYFSEVPHGCVQT